MARIPQHVVDKIYNAIDIVDIVSDYVPLKKRGGNFWGLSPFAPEKTPSFAVNPVKGIYKDFSSGKGGNAINFIMEMEGYDYVEALRHVARKYSIELEEEEETPEVKEKRDKRQSFYVVNEFAAKYFNQQLLESPDGKQIGLPYFKERGILDSTIKDFQLGFCHDEWEAFAKEAVAKKYNEEYLIELGLVSKSEKTGNLVDRFRGRVMFPIHNPVGKVIGFGGRILGKKTKIAKYINSPESPIYHKSQVLYGMHVAKKHIRDKDLCILTEGYMDTIVLHQNDIRNVVASSGTALTPDQIRLIRRFTKNVLLIYDGDAAGIKAAMRGIDLLLKEDMAVNLLVLPDNHDPDSYVIEYGAQAFLDFIDTKALSFLDFKMYVMDRSSPDSSDPRYQAEMIKSLAETIGKIPDRIQRQMYIKHVAQKVDITESLMMHAVEEAREGLGKLEAREKKREEARKQVEAPAEVKDLKAFDKLPLATQEKELLRIILNYPDKSYSDYDGPEEDEEGNPIEVEGIPLLEYLSAELEGLSFENEFYEKVKQLVFTEFAENSKININNYLNHEQDDVRKLVSELLIFPHEISPGWRKHGAYVTDLDGNMRKTLEGSVYHYKSKKVDRLLIECKAKLKTAHNAKDAEESDRQLEFFMYLSKMRKDIFEKLGTEGAIGGNDGRL